MTYNVFDLIKWV